MTFIENLILILATYIALKALHTSIEELVWLPLVNPNPLLKAMVPLALAFALEYLNISTIIPNTSRGGAKEKILTAPPYTVLCVILLEIGQPIRIALSRRAKAIYTLILLLVSSPWTLLLPTQKSEDIASPRPMKEGKGDTMLKQEIVEATRVALESLRTNLTQLLGDWVIEFVDILKLRNVLKKDYVEIIKKLFTDYSIISLNIEETSSEDLQKLLKLYCDKEMLKNLGELAQNFVLIIPVIAITRSHYQLNLGIRLRTITIYIAIPVIIALNPWTEPERMSKFRELLRGREYEL
jgi:hypothetical protein